MKTNSFFALMAMTIVIFFTACSEDTLSLEESLTPESNHEIIDESGLKRSCGHEHHNEQLKQDDAYRLLQEKKIERVDEYLRTHLQSRSACANPPVVPVAVHYQGVTNPNQSCLKALAQNQIDILNADFGGTNSDISKWTNDAASRYPGVSNGQSCMTFAIANKNHPTGFGLSDGQPAITFNQTNNDQDNRWSGYLNIYVQFGTGVLGYAPYGGSGNGDGVVIEATAFGAGSGCGTVAPDAPYDLGRTTTHEVGHYMLLDHIWGDQGGCNQDDDVADTPNQSQDNGGCPGVNTSSCNSRDLHMNYMDYTNDACMYMFSAGQSARMEAYLNSNLSNLTNNASNVIGGVTDPGDGGGNGGDDNNEDNDDDTADTCDTPTSTSVSNITTTSAKVSWTTMPSAVKYRVRWRAVGTTRWTGKSQTATSRNITGLTADTDYEYQVRTRCATGWTGWTAKKVFATDGNGGGGTNNSCDGTEVLFSLTLDDYGSETSWELIDDNGDRVATGGPYQDGKDGTTVTEAFCLPNGCYTMYVDDAFGDGICCDYGNGSFDLSTSNNDDLGSSNGNFGTYDYIDFCVDESSARQTGGDRDAKKSGLARKGIVSN